MESVQTTSLMESSIDAALSRMENQLKNAQLKKRKGQRGFTLIELSVVLIIIALFIAAIVFGVSRTNINAKTPTAIAEFVRSVNDIRTLVSNAGATPYSAITTPQYASILRNNSVFKVISPGASATITHNLATLGAGTVTVAPATVTSAGDSYNITITGASYFACPELLAGIDPNVLAISINGTSVKALGGSFNALAAGPSCTLGDTNTFVLQVN